MVKIPAAVILNITRMQPVELSLLLLRNTKCADIYDLYENPNYSWISW